jgi:hypothetical protein
VLDEILQERVVSSRGRRNPRGVKRKMSNWPLRPRESRPTTKVNFAECIQVLDRNRWDVPLDSLPALLKG